MGDISDEVGKTIGLIIAIAFVFFWILPAQLLPLLEVGGSEMWSITIFSYGSYILGVLLIIVVILYCLRG